MKAELFEVLERRFREMFHAQPDIEMDEIHLWVTRETDGALLYTSWAEAEAVLRPLMDEAIEAGDAQCIDRLAEAMVYVLTELQTQEQPNG